MMMILLLLLLLSDDGLPSQLHAKCLSRPDLIRKL